MSYAVAWACARHRRPVTIFLAVWYNPGLPTSCACEVRERFGAESARRHDTLEQVLNSLAYTQRPTPFWSRMRDASAPDQSIIMEEAAGWPFRCAWWCVRERRGRSMICHGWNLSGHSAAPAYAGISTVLPLAPVWPGLAADSAIYGAAAWCLLVVAHAAGLRRRAWHRRSRHRCPNCGYDLAGLGPVPCPECGRTPSRRVNAPPAAPAHPLASPASLPRVVSKRAARAGRPPRSTRRPRHEPWLCPRAAGLEPRRPP